MKKHILLALGALALLSLPAHAQKPSITGPQAEGPHISVITSNAYLGYQIELLGEEIRDIKAGGVVFHAPKIGGLYRHEVGDFKNTYSFLDYTFVPQPVRNRTTDQRFGRFTHLLDWGAGYFFPLFKDRIEIAPFVGVSAQFNHNDSVQEDDSIFYHVGQSRTGLGAGTKFAVRFDDSLPFPLFLYVNAAYYPLTFVSTDSENANFPDSLQMFHMGFSWYGRFKPYWGVEAGFRQQLHFGGTASQSNAFSGSWSEFFVNSKFEIEPLMEEFKKWQKK